VWEVVEGQDVLSINDDCGVLQGAIIRRLLDLASDGVTDKDTLKTEALKQLPLR
jgi:hypothetical protein